MDEGAPQPSYRPWWPDDGTTAPHAPQQHGEWPPSHPSAPPLSAPHLPQAYAQRRRPPHPDEFTPSYAPYGDYHAPHSNSHAHASSEISPLAQASYPLYPPPLPASGVLPQFPTDGQSPTHSVHTTPSPYDTPVGNAQGVPLPFMHPLMFDQAPSSDIMFNAVESARWMATLGGTYSDPQPGPIPLPLPPPVPPLAMTPSSSGPQPPAPLDISSTSRIIAGPSSLLERRWSDSSIASMTSPVAGPSSLPNPGWGGYPPSLNEEEDGEGNTPVKPFIEKLFNILSRPATYGDCIKWSASGDSFFVAHTEKLTRDVLPEHFSHSNIHSFTRQLNVYNFTRMSVRQLREGLSIPSATTSEYSGWSHPHFRRGDATSLNRLTPRPSRARMLKKLEKQYGGAVPGGVGGASEAIARPHHAHRGSMGRIDEYG